MKIQWRQSDPYQQQQPVQQSSAMRQYVQEHGAGSDNTAYMRWATELEKKEDIVDKEFLSRNKRLAINVNKFPALAFYESHQERRLRYLRNINLILAQNAGLDDVADETIYANIDDIQVSRGWKGNFTKALQTWREEYSEEQKEIKAKRRGLMEFFRGKKEPQQQVVQQQ